MDINRRITYTAQHVISDTGSNQIKDLLTSFKEQPWMGERKYMPPLPPTFEFVWVNRDGKFTKRVSKYYFETFGIRLPDEVISAVGNLAREHSTEGITYYFEIVDKIDWLEGEFGDYGSCYWSVRSAAKDMIMQNGGYAIRYFNAEDAGIARAWLFNAGDFWVIWNGYGFAGNPTLIISRMVAQWMGLNYQRISLFNKGNCDNTLYINGCVGYAVGHAVGTLETYDFNWDELFTCITCEKTLDEASAYFSPDYESYCETCFNKELYVCDACGRSAYRVWMPDATSPDGKPLCEQCAENQHLSQQPPLVPDAPNP